ncbi:MAG: hypothetical protein H7249_05795 [Chitinophagaceae bacterium]|nr:hypothetical protein [Oligoflexus sp.]
MHIPTLAFIVIVQALTGCADEAPNPTQAPKKVTSSNSEHAPVAPSTNPSPAAGTIASEGQTSTGAKAASQPSSAPVKANPEGPSSAPNTAASPSFVSLTEAMKKKADALKAMVLPLKPQENNIGNAYVYGDTGTQVEIMGKLYEVSHDRAVLDKLIEFADKMLSARNDPATGYVKFTGNRELCWGNDLAKTFACGEGDGDVIGHIAYVAKLIAQSKSLWNESVSITDTYNYGKTYDLRARTYIREMTRSIDTFITPNFVRPADKKFYTPDTAAYAAVDKRNWAIAWNRQMMLASGYQRVAETLEIWGEQAEKIKSYDAIVNTNVKWFLSEMETSQVNGTKVLKYSYDPRGLPITSAEDTTHAAHDYWGYFRTYLRPSLGMPQSTLKMMADTFRYKIWLGEKNFAGKIDGTSGDAGTHSAPRTSVNSEFIFYALFTPEIFPAIATNLNALDIGARSLWMDYYKLGGVQN